MVDPDEAELLGIIALLGKKVTPPYSGNAYDIRLGGMEYRVGYWVKSEGYYMFKEGLIIVGASSASTMLNKIKEIINETK